MNRAHLIASAPLALLAIALTSSSAQAGTTCTADADCAPGYLCNIVSATGCAAPACAQGEKCLPPPDCETTEVRECTPGASCKTDADCSPELRCFTSTYGECTGSASSCSRDQPDCPPQPPPECTTRTITQCISRYQSSCTSNADCGPKLSCVQTQRCTCSGSGDRTTGKTTEEACTCTYDGPRLCDLADKSCTQTSDCPAGWSCGNSGCGVSSDGTTSCPDDPAFLQCSPPYQAGGSVAVGGDDGVSTSGGTGATGTGAAGGPGSTPGSDTTGNGPTGGGTRPGGSHGRPVSPWVNPGGGIWCQFSAIHSAASPTGFSALLGLLGLAAFRRRRSAK